MAIGDSFQMQTKDTIQKRMVADMQEISDLSVIEGAFARDAINANSVEFQNAYAEMNLLAESAFATSSWGEYLTARAEEYGVIRKEAQYAYGVVTFTGSQGALIPAHSLVQTALGLKFYTDEECSIQENGQVSVRVTAADVGTEYNVAAETVTYIPMSITGVRYVTNPEAMHDGSEEETDDELRARYLQIVRTPATSGNAGHYYNWAMSIEGVGVAKVLPLNRGNGTVDVIILNSEMKTASADLIARVQTYIDSVRPIGADVLVWSPVPTPIDITVDISGVLDVDIFKSALASYIQGQGLDLKYISSAQIGKLIMQQPTVKDYDNLLINGQTKIVADEHEILGIGEISVNNLTAVSG